MAVRMAARINVDRAPGFGKRRWKARQSSFGKRTGTTTESVRNLDGIGVAAMRRTILMLSRDDAFDVRVLFWTVYGAKIAVWRTVADQGRGITPPQSGQSTRV
jgi:hypothetical protein